MGAAGPHRRAGGPGRPRGPDVRLRADGGAAAAQRGGRRLPGQRVRHGRARRAVPLPPGARRRPAARRRGAPARRAAGAARLLGPGQRQSTGRAGSATSRSSPGSSGPAAPAASRRAPSGAGLATGLVAVIVLAIAGIGGSTYEGRLTGFLGDPNAGAYFIAVLGTLAVFFCDERWKVRAAVAVPIVVGLVLCLSRTGLLAGAFVDRLGRRWDAASARSAGAADGGRARVDRQQHPEGPHHLRPVLRPLRQRQPPQADHRPGAASSWPTRRGTATAPARRRSTSATSSSSSTTPTSPSARRAAGSRCSSCWRSSSSPSSGSRTARAPATSSPPGPRARSSASASWPSPSARCCSTPPWRSPSRSPSATRSAPAHARRDAPDG